MAALATVALSVVALLAWGAIERHAAAAPFAIEWLQLMPPSQQLVDPRLLALGVVDHTKPNPNLKASQPKAGEVVWRYHEKRVQIGGYAVPIDYDGTKITVFLLVPYAGACIHVPPPPANQNEENGRPGRRTPPDRDETGTKTFSKSMAGRETTHERGF